MSNNKSTSNIKIRLCAYSISESVERQLQEILKVILEKYNCLDILAPIYVSIKELIINAIKANFKNIYFEDYSPKNRPDEIIDYKMSLKLFKLELSRENANYLETIARKDDIKAEIEFWTENKTLHVSVINPVNMTETEIKNVNQKLIDAENCEDLSDYFLTIQNDPNREGAGLGLVLITMMLKSLSAPENSLEITSKKNQTRAYIKIPLRSEIELSA